MLKKKAGKPKLSAKEKRERGLLAERVANALPLEFRGGDPNLRRQIEHVVEGFLDRPGRGLARASLPFSLFPLCLWLCSNLVLTTAPRGSPRAREAARPQPGAREQVPHRPRE